MNQKLSSFVAHAKQKGMDSQTIRMLLLAAGWKEKEIAAAVASQALDMPVPVPTDAGSAKDAFFHLLAFTTLYSTVINLIILAFQFVSRLFPDVTESSYAYTSTTSPMRWSIAFIVVSFPLFIFVARALHKELVLVPEKLASGVRRWLTYLTLFVTACTIVGDLVTVLYFLLDGELTIRFLLKASVILFCTAIPFAYYFSVLRMDHDHYRESLLHRRVLTISIVVVLVSLGFGMFIVGSPGYGRSQRLDAERVSDLRAIQNQIYEMTYGPERFSTKTYLKTPKPLPATLQDIANTSQYQRLRTTDPLSGDSYVYEVSGNSFSLCADFSLPLDLDYDIFWNHPAGHHCFVFDSLDSRGK